MSRRSLNEILINIPTESFDFIFAAYNLRFILPRVVYICTQRDYARRIQQRFFYLPFYICDSSIAQKTCPRSLRSVTF